jgi:hypothetical protein
MTGEPVPTTTSAPTAAPAHRALAATSAVLGVSTAVTLAIGWSLAASAPGMEGLAIGVMALFAIVIIGFASLVVGIFAVSLSRPRWAAVVGLVLTVATFLFVGAQFVPWGSLGT